MFIVECWGISFARRYGRAFGFLFREAKMEKWNRPLASLILSCPTKTATNGGERLDCCIRNTEICQMLKAIPSTTSLERGLLPEKGERQYDREQR